MPGTSSRAQRCKQKIVRPSSDGLFFYAENQHAVKGSETHQIPPKILSFPVARPHVFHIHTPRFLTENRHRNLPGKNFTQKITIRGYQSPLSHSHLRRKFIYLFYPYLVKTGICSHFVTYLAFSVCLDYSLKTRRNRANFNFIFTLSSYRPHIFFTKLRPF
jgi:hypothetical protein